MFLRLTTRIDNRGTTARLYVNRATDGSLRIEEYTSDMPGNDTRCVYGRTLTAEQATELREFLASQGY